MHYRSFGTTSSTTYHTALATNIAHGAFYWKSQYLNLNWYYGNQRGVVGGSNIQIIWLIDFLHMEVTKFVAESTVTQLFTLLSKNVLPKIWVPELWQHARACARAHTHTHTHTCWYNEIWKCAAPYLTNSTLHKWQSLSLWVIQVKLTC
jgi:hypothetical protein